MNDVKINLTPILREIESVGNQLAQRIDAVNAEVGHVRGDLQTTQGQLAQLRQDFAAFVTQAERTAAVQQSETKVGSLKAELDREFGHYAVVRRTSTGILQAFDVGVISNETVTSVSEELMLQTPRYWLAPALVALAAWSRDNQELAERGVQEAFARDKNKTSLFFALVLRRQGRLQGSDRWLRHYLNSLDPVALTREFAVVLEAASYDAFGPAGQRTVSEVMTRWVRELRNRPDIVETQVRSWVSDIGMQRQVLDTAQYAELAALSPDFPALQRQIESASALPEAYLKYEQVKQHDGPIPTVLEDLLDDILDRLVTEYDEEELPLKREVVYHEAVIAERGDLDRARARADEIQAALDETIDAVSLRTRAATTPEQLGVSVQTQRIAVGVSIGDFTAAVGRFCAAYRSAAIHRTSFVLGPDHSTYASTYGFTGCQVSSDDEQATGEATIRDTWDRSLRAYLDTLRFKGSWYVVPGLVALGVAVVVGLVNVLAGAVALVVGGAAVALLGERARRAAQARIDQVEASRDKAVEHSVQLYRDAAAQLVDARILYDELDQQESDLLGLLATWPTAVRDEENEMVTV